MATTCRREVYLLWKRFFNFFGLWYSLVSFSSSAQEGCMCGCIDFYGPMCVNIRTQGSFDSYLNLSILKMTCFSLPPSTMETCVI